MNLVWVLSVVMVGLLIWVSVLSWLYWRQHKLLQSIIPGSGDPSLSHKFIQLLKDIDDINDREEFLAKNFKNQARQNLKNIQKVALSHYNPYQDVGGAQSFSLVMLNGVDSGVMMTSLHTRAGTRVYAKSITKAQSETGLSKEEQEVLDEAMKT